MKPFCQESFAKLPASYGAAGPALLLLAAGFAAMAPAQARPKPPQVAMAPAAIRPLPQSAETRFARTKSLLQPSARAWIEQQGRSEAQKQSPDLEGIRAAVKLRFGACAEPKGGTSPRINAVAVGAGASSASRGPVTSMAAGCPGSSDIEELAFLVLMEAAKDSEEDLRQIMAHVKAINNAKASQRESMQKLQEVESGIRGAAAKSGNASKSPCTIPDCRSLVELSARLSQSTARGNRALQYNAPAQMTYAQALQLAEKMKQDLDSMSDLSQVDQMKLQQAMDRRSKMEEMISNLLKKISDTQSSIIGNLK